MHYNYTLSSRVYYTGKFKQKNPISNKNTARTISLVIFQFTNPKVHLNPVPVHHGSYKDFYKRLIKVIFFIKEKYTKLLMTYKVGSTIA